ncbi:MAG TPA: uracil-DNA glycosylase family protein [Gemmatimonadaceae bacterium]
MGIEDRLRRYLEQRRELGERELVLDDMSVDEVMKLLGAASGTRSRSKTTHSGDEASRPRGETTRSEGEATGGAGRPADQQPPAVPSPSPSESSPTASADWREALRAAGADRSAGGKAPGAKPRNEPPRPSAGAGDAPQRPEGTDAMPRSTDEGGRPARPSGGADDPPPPQSSDPLTPDESPAIASGLEGVRSGIVVGPSLGEPPVGPIANCTSLEEIAAMVSTCVRCDLCRTATNPVPGEGSPTARVMCIGEAPGAREDATGRPFVGQAGELLTKILAAINLNRDEVFITNVLKHRPPGNRNPLPDEVTACRPYLVRQVELIHPAVIITFGAFAAQTLLETKLPIGKLRGAIHRYHGIPVVATYHPAALLRNPAWKRPTWEDVQLARRLLDSASA